MRKHISIGVICGLAVLLGAPFAADAEDIRFRGTDSSRLDPFAVAGPWTMDWTASSDFPKLATIEIRLYDGESGDYIGMVAELRGTGSGYKLFEQAGSYQIVIVGTSINWDIVIQEVSEEQAASMARGASGEPSLLDTTRRFSNRVPQGGIVSWRAEGNDTLLLFEDGGIGRRVSFTPAACPGLEKATAVSFVTPQNDPEGSYDSILLDDGTRCYFGKVIPSYAP
jgi:hypothetical protein